MEEGAHLPGTVFTESNRSTHETALTCHMPPRAAKRALLKRNQTSALCPPGRPAVVPILPLLRGKPLQPSPGGISGSSPIPPSPFIPRRQVLRPLPLRCIPSPPASRPGSPQPSRGRAALGPRTVAMPRPRSSELHPRNPSSNRSSDSGQTSVNTQIRARDSPLRSFGDLELCDTTEPPQRALP